MRGGLESRPTQCKQILMYLMRNDKITSFEAYTELGITQLAARLRNLEDKGYTFNRQRVVKKKPDGSRVSYIEYSVERVGEAI